MFKILFGLVAALLFSSAHALIPSGYQYRVDSVISQNPWVSSPSVACQNFANYAGRTMTGISGTAPSFQCLTSGWGPANILYQASCPANSTPSGGQCACAAGHEEVGGTQCLPANSQCQVGKGRTFNRTEGWARSSSADANDVVSNIGPVGSLYNYNDGTCVGNIASVDKCFRSQEPSTQGLYRISCDYTMVVSGSSHSAGDTASSPTTPNATCPGFVGTINEKPVCVGTASSPLPSPSNAPNQPTAPGNPAAGPKPSTGPGSGSDGPGRTPATGAGGNAGGPAGAAVGRGGTGERGEDGEDGTAVCGAAPLPACNVKVDETGTPAEGAAASKFGAATTALNEQTTALEGLMTEAKELTLPGWSWSFSFPTGCTPLVLEALDFVLDVCQFQPVIHDLMSMVWVIVGFFGFLGLFRETFGG